MVHRVWGGSQSQLARARESSVYAAGEIERHWVF